MFTIMRGREYFHKDGKIILFENPQEANEFINYLIHYSVQQLQSEGRMGEAMSAPMIITQQSRLTPVDFDINAVECGVVYCKDLRKQ